MRPAAQLRGGYYPAPPEAVAHTASFLRPPPTQSFAILDPCAGQGAAIGQLAGLLDCPPACVHAIELDEGRAEDLRAGLPEAQVLAPASFFGCRASLSSFSFTWVNPPFDDGYGGCRVEAEFLRTATQWLIPGGVMALVCPEDVADEYSDTRHHFVTHYESCSIVPFPQAHRRFREVIVFGRKRARSNLERSASWSSVQAREGFRYSIPPGLPPRTFLKVEPTPDEFKRMLRDSPLRSYLTTPAAASLPSPPLALGMGHVALLLASGHLDGLVAPEGQPAHVVRGSSRKREYVSDVSESENPDGTTTTKTTISEKIELVVRTVDATGRLRTFMDTDGQACDATPVPTATETRRRRNGRRPRACAS